LLKFFPCAAVAALLLVTPAHASERASKARQEEVAKRGAQVMPFSPERTLHIFEKTNSGGIQQVIAKDPSDTGQMTLIREHLSKISKEFANGTFPAPAGIHGKDMPGLAELEKTHPGQLKIEHNKKAYKAADFPNATGSTAKPPEVFGKSHSESSRFAQDSLSSSQRSASPFMIPTHWP
jgi:hypothetical protein